MSPFFAKAVCPECKRIFDLLDENDAGEWYYGHDCEPPSPPAAFGGYQVGFGTIDSAAGPRQGAPKSENADHLYRTLSMFSEHGERE
jgi:hypothetical protein